jgi:hypothetical protein
MRPFARNRSFAGWFVKFRAESLRSGREFRYANDRSWPPAAPWMEIVGELTLSTPCGHSRPTAIGQRILREKPGAWPGLSVQTVVRLSSDALLLATTQH